LARAALSGEGIAETFAMLIEDARSETVKLPARQFAWQAAEKASR